MASTTIIGRRDLTGAAALRLLLAAALALMSIPFLSGPSWADDFSNTTPIVMARAAAPMGCPPVCPADQADPYPSTISVAGLTGTITDVNVFINDLTYGKTFGTEVSSPSDIDMMLVAPNGSTSVMIMSDNCGSLDDPRPIITPIDLGFDDSAANPLPDDTACNSGTFKPNDDDNDGEAIPFRVEDTFPGTTAIPPTTTAPLSTFNGLPQRHVEPLHGRRHAQHRTVR